MLAVGSKHVIQVAYTCEITYPLLPMKNARQTFHIISYVQYPLMLLALAFAIRPYLTGFDSIWHDFKYLLIFAGLGISFSTLQDTTKVQNTVSRKVWEDAKKSRIMLLLMLTMALSFILFGMFGFFVTANANIQEIAIGMVVLGIGLIGMLKSAIEMAEHHRKK